MKVSVFWFRRDLRLFDNAGLYHALKSGNPVIPLFIFDTNILDDLEDKKDRRVEFIHKAIAEMDEELRALGSGMLVKYGAPQQVWKELLEEYDIAEVYTNHDYEPYAKEREQKVEQLLAAKGVRLHTFKDQVILEKSEVMKDNGDPYIVFTPYSKQWRKKENSFYLKSYPVEKYQKNFHQYTPSKIPKLKEIGFQEVGGAFPSKKVREELLKNYGKLRDYPAEEGTSKISVHLRFGTVSIRQLMRQANEQSYKYATELIWREFYQMILYHFPQVVNRSFRPEYDNIKWLNREEEFEKWCEGRTGFPIVDAGMRELNDTGYMHNRVRMIVASFLTKDLLIDWRWGEAYFARKLLDFDLASNNGGWQWAAGTGVDAAPYFRIFNPEMQAKKFDPDNQYIKQWVPEFGTDAYPEPMVDHREARQRCLDTYKQALG